jgi:hypothetical protein
MTGGRFCLNRLPISRIRAEARRFSLLRADPVVCRDWQHARGLSGDVG